MIGVPWGDATTDARWLGFAVWWVFGNPEVLFTAAPESRPDREIPDGTRTGRGPDVPMARTAFGRSQRWIVVVGADFTLPPAPARVGRRRRSRSSAIGLDGR